MGGLLGRAEVPGQPLACYNHAVADARSSRWSPMACRRTGLPDRRRPRVPQARPDQAAHQGVVDAGQPVAAAPARRRGRHDGDVERARPASFGSRALRSSSCGTGRPSRRPVGRGQGRARTAKLAWEFMQFAVQPKPPGGLLRPGSTTARSNPEAFKYISDRGGAPAPDLSRECEGRHPPDADWEAEHTARRCRSASRSGSRPERQADACASGTAQLAPVRRDIGIAAPPLAPASAPVHRSS